MPCKELAPVFKELIQILIHELATLIKGLNFALKLAFLLPAMLLP